MAGNMEDLTPTSTITTISSSAGDVRVVQPSEYKEASYTLAEAFFHDDVGRYFIDTQDTVRWSEQQKWNLHQTIMEYMTYAHLLKGLVTTVGPNYGCVCLWMPPHTHMDDKLTLLRSGLWRLHYKLTHEGRQRFFNEFFQLLHHTKSSVLGPRDEDSYYLVYIGTREEARGKGFARKLISDMMAKADAEGRATYLESSNPVNLGFYRRMGFQAKKQIALKRGEKDVLLDVMVREPISVDPAIAPLPQKKTGPQVDRPKVKLEVTVPTTMTANGEKSPTTAVKTVKTHTVLDSKSLLA